MDQPTAPDFLKKLLSTYGGSIVLVPIWTVHFSGIPTQLLIKANDYQPGFCKDVPNINSLDQIATLGDQQGCLFAQAISIPAEGITVGTDGQQQGGLIRGYTNSGREDMNKIKISFLDTTASFAENILRPWVVMGAFLGMIARNQKYKCELTVHKWNIRGVSKPEVYQTWIFHDALPINVSSEEIEYTAQSANIRRQADFIFRDYTYTALASNKSQALFKNTKISR